MPVTANGYQYTTAVSVIAARWAKEALEACSFDPVRLQAVDPLWTVDGTGGYGVYNIHVHYESSDDIPNFPDDFVRVTFGENHEVNLGVWEGLESAPPPYGGRRFFKETILHGLGHAVGEWLAYAKDAWKRLEVLGAVYGDVLAELGATGIGTGGAWNFFEDDYIDGLAWRDNPKERFAEIFKDTFGHESARRFLNRCLARPSRESNLTVFRECQVYLPINFLDFNPHPGQFTHQGVIMKQGAVDAGSLIGNCPLGSYVCADPCTGALIACFPCGGGNYQTGPFCADSFSRPCEHWDNIQWGIETCVPQLPFCRKVGIDIAPVQADFNPWSYVCGGQPTPSYQNGRWIIRGSNFNNAYSFGDAFEQADQLNGNWPGPGDNPDKHLNPEFSGFSSTLDVNVDDLDKSTRFHVSAGGYFAGVQVNPAHAMGAHGPEIPGVAHYIYGPYRLSAPSLGSFRDPYAQLNLDALEQGGRVSTVAVGTEEVVADILYGARVPGPQFGSQLTPEGI